MSRLTCFALFTVSLAALAAEPALAQGPPARPKACPACEPCDCPCAEAPPSVVRESALAQCGDGLDNDGDGHVDCADQDCDIYAICVGDDAAAGPPPDAAAAPVRSYTTMKQLKTDLRARVISGQDFWRWQQVIRSMRTAEIEAARAQLHARQISHAEYRILVAAIRAKYEG
jgi:hypothetical protein